MLIKEVRLALRRMEHSVDESRQSNVERTDVFQARASVALRVQNPPQLNDLREPA